MEIIANGLTKNFSGHFVIKDFTFHFQTGSITGLSGPNGSGKSTLIKMLSGFLTPGAGKIQYVFDGNEIERKNIYRYISVAAPYSSIIREYSLEENFDLFRKFKTCRPGISYKELLDLLEWKNPRDKRISQYSSGMVQKVNLIFAMISGTELLLLDEPTSYLDEINKSWYHKIAEPYFKGRTVIIASNEMHDFREAGHIIKL